jgi:hypothetical protein
MVSFKQLSIKFDSTKGKRQRETATAVFNSKVKSAEAVLKGFNIRYSDGDHHVLEQEIDLDIIKTEGNTVTVAADFLLRDSSGNIDDRFQGWVQCVVIANT